MKKAYFILFTVIFGLGIVFGWVSFVSAQEESEFTLEEIIVTAEKRSENLQKVSMSIAVIQGEELANQGAVTIQDILKDIPNVSTSDAGGGNGFMINIRGLGNDMPAGVGESSVSINSDGAYQGRSDVGMFGYFDIDQVEVLRGPQGTLYGRNSTGGVVNITSKKPTTDQVEGYVSLEVGDFKKLKQEAAINVPITDTFAARLALVNTRQNAYTYDSSNYRDSQSGLATRLQMRYTPGNDISVNFIYSYTVREGGLWSDVLKTTWDEGKYYLNTNVYPYDTTTKNRLFSEKFSLTVEAPMGPGVLTVIPTYQKDKGRSYTYTWNTGGPNAGTATYSAGYRPWQDTSEILDLRYASKSDSKVKWTTGLYWTKQDSPQLPTDTMPNATRWADSKAALGQLTYPFTDSFRGVVGGRYTVDKKGFDDIDWNTRDTDYTLNTDSFSFKYFDWKLGIEKDLAQDVMTYFTMASGHKPGGYSEMDGTPFEVESNVSGELGMKSRFMENRMQLNGALFYYKYKGYQVVDAKIWHNPDTDLDEMQVKFFNAPSVRSMGAEIDTNIILGKATGLDVSFSYLKNEYLEDFEMHADVAGPDLDMKGKTMPHSPEFNVKAGIEHTFSFRDGSTLRPKVSYRWTSEQYYGVQPLPETLGPSFSVCDFTMIYTSAKSWYLNLYANNALDAHYYTGSTRQGGDMKYFVASPRVMGLTLNIKF